MKSLSSTKSQLTVATVIPCDVLTKVTICGWPEVPPVVTFPALCTVIICLEPGVKAWVPLAAFNTVLPGAATLIVWLPPEVNVVPAAETVNNINAKHAG